MKNINEISIFLASPSDVTEERKSARKVIAELNRTVARMHNCQLRIIGWETDTIPAFGDNPQELVNTQIGEMQQHDLFTGIMWNRFGSPTKNAGSGTEEEFNLAVDAFRKTGQPDIQFYFNNAPSTLNTAAELEERRKVLEFRSRYKQEGLYRDYNGTINFEELFRNNITLWLANKFTKTPNQPEQTRRANPSSKIKPQALKTAPTTQEAKNWLLLDNHFFELRALSEPEATNVNFTLLSGGPGDDATLRALRPQSSFSEKITNFAYGLEGGLARIKAVVFEVNGTQSTWNVEIEPTSSIDIMDDMSFNNNSADQLAEMRADLILLNKPIPGKDTMLDAFVRGFRSNLKVPDNLLPDLWDQLGENEIRFIEFAKLWATLYLKATNTCEQILKLDFGPIHDGKMRVDFKGRRRKIYSNEDATVIAIKGMCEMSQLRTSK